jgi:eukaryotic-like serine/threonine-protein kinase
MVAVPAGWFTMGDDGGLEDERPAHRVFVSAFRIDRLEVSVGRYERCVRAGACTPPETAGSETRPDYFTSPRYRDHPVVGVTWRQAVAYCRWRHARLPTEAEWEKAARGTDRRLYPWGSRFAPARLNYCDRRCRLPWRDRRHDDGSEDTTPVDAHPAGASPYGALEMAGNVWEWVADWYGPSFYERSPARDPTGPAGGTQRVTRGGGIFDDRVFTRATVRRRFVPTVASTSTGFRCLASS